MDDEQRLFTLFERKLADVLVKALSRRTKIDELNDGITEMRVYFSEVLGMLNDANLRIAELEKENRQLHENINAKETK